MLNFDDMDIFDEQITNAFQIAIKYNMTSFAYQTNCQMLMIYEEEIAIKLFRCKNVYVQKNICNKNLKRNGQ